MMGMRMPLACASFVLLSCLTKAAPTSAVSKAETASCKDGACSNDPLEGCPDTQVELSLSQEFGPSEDDSPATPPCKKLRIACQDFSGNATSSTCATTPGMDSLGMECSKEVVGPGDHTPIRPLDKGTLHAISDSPPSLHMPLGDAASSCNPPET